MLKVDASGWQECDPVRVKSPKQLVIELKRIELERIGVVRIGLD